MIKKSEPEALEFTSPRSVHSDMDDAMEEPTELEIFMNSYGIINEQLKPLQNDIYFNQRIADDLNFW